MNEIRWWAKNAASGIRFRPDREDVERELLEHMEDKQELLMRVRGLEEKEAGLEAVRQMGDAWEVSRELARIHRPWLGWLWRASRVLLVLTLALSLLIMGPPQISKVQTWWNNREALKMMDPLEPYAGGNERFGDNIQLWTRKTGYSVRSDDYLFRVERTALWSGKQEDGEEYRILYCRLKAYGLPWQPFSHMAAQRIQATDSTGKTYRSTYEMLTLSEWWKEEPSTVLSNSEMYDGLFDESFVLEIFVPVEARWLRLEFDRGGPNWSLTIPLTEETA